MLQTVTAFPPVSIHDSCPIVLSLTSILPFVPLPLATFWMMRISPSRVLPRLTPPPVAPATLISCTCSCVFTVHRPPASSPPPCVQTSMRVFPPERGLMIRERSTGSYRVGPYFLAKSTSDIGLYTVAPILYATAVYWCVGLRSDAGVFFKFLLLFMGQVRAERGGVRRG